MDRRFLRRAPRQPGSGSTEKEVTACAPRRLLSHLPAVLLVLALPGVSRADSLAVLHSFGGPDGETPAAPLVQGADGFLYGVAAHGGDFTVLPPDGGGTAFRMDANGTFTTLHLFHGPEGARPEEPDPGSGRLLLRHGDATAVNRRSRPSSPGSGRLPHGRDRRGDRVARLPAPIDGGSSQPGPIVQGADGALYGTVRWARSERSPLGGLRLPIRSGHRRLPPPARLRRQRRRRSRPDRSSRPATDSSTGRPTRVGPGIRASSTRSTSSATSRSSTASHRSVPARARSRRAA